MVESREPPSPRDKLRSVIAGFGGAGFALVDGGHFDDLPALLKRARLFGRSLFLDGGDRDAMTAGPWLIKLDQAPEATEGVLGLVGERPALVVWCCPDGEAVLHRHLRSINMVRIPIWATVRKPRPDDAVEAEANEAVLFRHWDPRVLGALMPVLDAAQFARMLGPARELAFVTDDFGGCRRVVAQSDWPRPPSGLLTIRAGQVDALAGRRDVARRRRMMAFLRDTAADETGGMDDAELHHRVLAYEASAARLGVRGERAQSTWAYLMLTTNGSIEGLGSVRRHLASAHGEPDEKVQRLLQDMLRLARTDREIA